MISQRSVWIGLLLLVLMLPAAFGQASHSTEDSWRKRLEQLEGRIQQLEKALGGVPQAQPLSQDYEARLAALETRVAALSAAVLAAGVAQSADAPVAATTTPDTPGPAPSPERITPSSGEGPEPLPIAGYMEMHLNKREGAPSQLDFHRFVLLFGHQFTPRLKFWSELELEHAFVEGGDEKGELELEQAYLDFMLSPYLNLRGGMVLAPMGILNERHEPTAFFGVERPQVDTVIIPSTWFDAGAGIWGDLGRGLSYRAYVMAPLDASRFSAEAGLRGGLQKGFQSDFRHAAKTIRVEYRGVPRLVMGSSFWTGDTAFDVPGLKVPTRVFDLDGRFRFRSLDARAQYSHNWIGNAAELNRALVRRRGTNPNIAEQMRGFYLEGGYHMLPRETGRDLVAFLRYENYDTQFRMPAGFLPLKQFDRSNWTMGLNYYPHPDVALKFDYIFNKNESSVVRPRHQLNIGLGWWF